MQTPESRENVLYEAGARLSQRFVVFFRIAVFSVSVLHDERIVVVAEQRPDASEEDSFQWMSRVLQVPYLHQFTLLSFSAFSTYPLHNQLILAFRSLLC